MAPQVMTLRRYVPIARWAPAYPQAWLRADLVGGVTSWAVMVPVALAYAELAGVPAGLGLVTAFAALAAYAVFGTSRHLKVTTSSTMAVMSASLVAPLAAGDADRYLALSAALAVVVGILLLAAGLARLGFIADFLSEPVVTGFVIGLAITIIVGQLPKLLGVPGTSGSVLDQLLGVLRQLGSADLVTLAVGVGSMVLILALRRFVPIVPAPLVAVGAGIVAAIVLRSLGHPIAVVGTVETGLPSPSIPWVPLSDLAYLAAGGAGMVFLAAGESIGAGRAFGSRHGYRIEADQELLGLGAANVSSGLFGGFTVDASLSQSAAAETAGVRSQVSSLVTSTLLLATVVILAPLFSDLPMAVLAAVVMVSVASLIDIPEMRRYLAWDRSDFLLAVTALVGVVLTSVLVGMGIAVLISLVLLLYHITQPATTELGRSEDGSGGYRDVTRHPEATRVPGLLIVRVDAPLYFFNAASVESHLLVMVASATPSPAAVLLDLGASSDLDVTTTDILGGLVDELRGRGIELHVAQVKGAVRDRMRRTGLLGRIGPDRVHISTDEAVMSWRARPPLPAAVVAASPAAHDATGIDPAHLATASAAPPQLDGPSLMPPDRPVPGAAAGEMPEAQPSSWVVGATGAPEEPARSATFPSGLILGEAPPSEETSPADDVDDAAQTGPAPSR